MHYALMQCHPSLLATYCRQRCLFQLVCGAIFFFSPKFLYLLLVYNVISNCKACHLHCSVLKTSLKITPLFVCKFNLRGPETNISFFFFPKLANWMGEKLVLYLVQTCTAWGRCSCSCWPAWWWRWWSPGSTSSSPSSGSASSAPSPPTSRQSLLDLAEPPLRKSQRW